MAVIRKEALHDILRKCLNPTILEPKDVLKFKSDLKIYLQRIWLSLATNNCGDTDGWLLHSRVAVVALYYLSDNIQTFYITMRYLCTLEDTKKLHINNLEFNFAIDTPYTFQVSVFYGLMCIFLIRKDLYTEEFKFIFDFIHAQCRLQTRHNHLYFQLLSQYVNNFVDTLTTEDFDNVFETVYYNVDKRDCSTLMTNILNKTEKTQSSTILNMVLNNMSWKYKQKYILINEILMKNKSLITTLPHDDCIRGLIYAQTIPNLSSSAAKLHNTITKNIDSLLWIEDYYKAFEIVLLLPGTTTLCCKNIIKYYIIQAFEVTHRSFFENIFQKLLESEETPVFTILSITVLGIKLGLFQDDYDFEPIINMGWNHSQDFIRNMSFDIICSTKDVNVAESYDRMRHFILLNINEADQSSRDSIKKSFFKFLKKIENVIIRLEDISDKIPVIKHSSEFFSWLITFLLNQFSRSSNYQRVSLSLTLLNVTLSIFSKQKIIHNAVFLSKFRDYMAIVPVFHTLNAYFAQFVNMLEICSLDEAPKIIQMILSELDLTPFQAATTFAIQELGLKHVCSSNMEVAENGQKLIELFNRIQTTETEQSLNVVKEMMYQQWNTLKKSKTINIIENNSLHSLISLVTNSINLYDSSEYYTFLCFLEDVVSNLLNVFALRVMLRLYSNFCHGVSKAFEDETSKYHACTVNCLWLILKASCKLAAAITIISRKDDITYRTFNLIYSVIQRCYHKGALEVAGDTLAVVVASATLHNYNVHVIDVFLNQIFEEIPGTSDANTTVRRAAETRIMLSTIAVNDKRIHKPFFHKTMNYLIRTLKTCLQEPNMEAIAPVQSLVLHCLQPLIMDTSVELHIVEYLTPITIFSLHSFDSSNWKVRNAALQTFGAVTNKLIGTASSNHGNASQHHATCLEEIFFKYGEIYNYIIKRLRDAKQRSLNVIIPIISFLSMSFGRKDVVVQCAKNQMQDLSNTLLNFLMVAPNLHVFVLAAKAYTTLCYHADINNEIQNNSRDILLCDKANYNRFFSLIFSLKLLSEKIIDDSRTMSDYNTIEKTVMNKLDMTLEMLKDTNTYFKVISGLLLYRPGLKAIQVIDMQTNLILLNSRQDITNQFPGIWECMSNKLQLIITFEEMSKAIDLIKVCLLENISINLKVICLKTVQDRIQIDKKAKQTCEVELINTLIALLYTRKFTRVRYLIDECIKLFVQLNLSHVSEEWRNQIMNDMQDIEHNFVPETYMPVFCSIYESSKFFNIPMIRFFEYCAEKCVRTLEKENPDFLILRSLIFICKYAKKTENTGILVQNLVSIYKLCQRGDEEFKTEREKLFTYCFETKPKHVYANMLDLLNKDNLIKLAGPHVALQFLVHIYSEQEDEKYGINVFDNKQTLLIETNILEDNIYEIIFDIYKNKLKNQTEFNLWFTKYKRCKPNNKYLDNLARVLL